MPEALALAIVKVSPALYPVPASLIVTLVIAPPEVVISTVHEDPPPPVTATPVALLYPVPPDNVPKLRASTPPRLGLVIVNVSPISYPEPAAFNAIPVITSPVIVVSTVNPEPVPPLVATPVALLNPPTPLLEIHPRLTTVPGVGSPEKFSTRVVEVERLLSIALNCSKALSSFACTLASV